MQCAQIWLVNFDPSVGHEYQKVRPAIIVQNTNYITLDSLVTIVPISSKMQKKTLLDVVLSPSNQNNMLVQSLIKVKQISSFDRIRFIKFIGIADALIMEQVKSNIKFWKLGRSIVL